MSFKTAYHGFKSGGSSNVREYIRDPTPEEWKRKMDEYYKQQRDKRLGTVQNRNF